MLNNFIEWARKNNFLSIGLVIILALTGCSQSGEDVTGDLPPMITINNKNYVAPYMPVDELPDGYEYIGDLPKEAANDTGVGGCHMYVIKETDSFSDFYLYQECGTPIDENTVDTTQLQWAYVQWILNE